MAAASRTGNLINYYNAQPYQGVATNGFQTGNITCYYNGQPYQFIFPNSISSYFFMFS